MISPRVERPQASSLSILEAVQLRIVARVGGRTHTIVSGIDLSVKAGEAVAIVGESGSGKSMTARSLMGLLPEGVAASGKIIYQGRDLLKLREAELARMRGADIGMVLQDPFTMLNPLMRCGDHITEMLRDAAGKPLSRDACRAEAQRRLIEVGIPDQHVADRYPFQLSGGMRQRVALAAALARNPKVLIADEVSTALDVTTQKEILLLLQSLHLSRGMATILITHDLRVAFAVSDRVYVLYAGSLMEVAQASSLENEPLHPYTLGLLLSEPPVDRRLSTLTAIAGSVPRPDDVANTCAFSPRCPWAASRCISSRPELRLTTTGRWTACIRTGEIAAEMRERRRSAEVGSPARVSTEVQRPLISAVSIAKAFGTDRGRREASVVALNGVSIEVRANESVGLVGESGSGKTTLGRCMVGLESADSGRICIDGVDVTDFRRLSSKDRVHVRRTIQMIFQDPYSSLNPARSIGSTLAEALSLGNPRREELRSMVEHLLARVGLPATYISRKPVALSGGERQRVAIARALAVEPRIIVCDEAVSALDVSVQSQILNLFKTLRSESEISLLFITHNLAVIRQIAERIYVIYRGEIVETGLVDDVLDHPKHPYTMRLVSSIPRSGADWLRAAN